MKHFFLIAKKELDRFWGDKQLLFSVLVLPFVMIFLMYSLIGKMQSSFNSDIAAKAAKVCIINKPSFFESLIHGCSLNIQIVDSMENEQAKTAIQDNTIDLLIAFPDEFDSAILQYDKNTRTAAPQVQIFYNSSNDVSSLIYNSVLSALSYYESTLVNKFDVNNDPTQSYDLADETSSLTNFYSTIIPSMLILFIFNGSIQAASESMAGEKERGTIATMFMTPLKKSEYAGGKILGLSCIAFLSGLSGFLGAAFSLPSMMNINHSALALDMYSGKDVLMIILVILSTVFLIVSIVSLLSCVSKSVKEAQAYCTPIMLLGSLAGVSMLFPQMQGNHIRSYFIPIYNSAKSFCDILRLEYTDITIYTTIITNMLWFFMLVCVITRLLHSEKIVFPE